MDFQDGGFDSDFGFLIKIIIATFDLQVSPTLPTKFPVNLPFCLGEVQNRFSRCGPSWNSHHNDFSYFRSTSPSDTSYQVSSQLAFPFRRSGSK